MSGPDDSVIIKAAAGEARRMLSAGAKLGSKTHVTLSAAHFAQLARLLAATADTAERRDEAFDRPVDGIRFWVPLPEMEAQRAELAALREASLRAAAVSGWDRLAF
ncbi:hypothetical protein [uncultured Sphingomonas sp.]|uniref:hypothetical protein n=1 Tax=uncultured Sphingomonas sp. TaxID=158754 RepID=UPI0035CB71F3